MTDGLTDSQQSPETDSAPAESEQGQAAETVQVHDGEQTPAGGNPDNPAFESSKQTLDEAAAGADTGSADTGSDDTGSDETGTDDDGDEGDDEDEGDPLDIEGEVAADYLEELLDIADLDGDIDTYVDGGRAHVSIVSESNTLVGAKGEVLDALQELARLAVMTETGNRSRLMLDVAGFRERRRKELQELAGEAVEQAKSSSESVRLSPMNPFERKIVHDAVAAAGLSSESEGEEPKRRVVVIPSA